MTAPQPRLSVVIASCLEEPYLLACLASLRAQDDPIPLELIVVSRASDAIIEAVRAKFPEAVILRRPRGVSIPELRRDGVLAAQAPYIAVLEERCIADRGWLRAARHSIERGVRVAGGPVAAARFNRLSDWLVYYTEYHRYAPPLNPGPAGDICGANCLYLRSILNANLPLLSEGFWEAGLHPRLLEQAEVFHIVPEMLVYKTGPFNFAGFLRQRFFISRAFAGMDRRRMRAVKRLVYALLSLLVSPLLAVRIARKADHRRFLAALPLFIPVAIVYAAGQSVGYLRGPGDSISKIE
jgi:glycosyltransferase involved in cell wall biosynthesis